MYERYTQYRGVSGSCNIVDYDNYTFYSCGPYEWHGDLGPYHYRRWQYHEVVLQSGESIVYYKSNASGEKLSPLASLFGPYSGPWDTGCLDFGTHIIISKFAVPVPGFCADGNRCVECDCEPIQATHYQIRWEFDRIVTLDSDGNSGNYYLSQIFPIPPGGVDDVVHRFAGFLAPYVSSRIRFCDANGAIKPYRGSGYIAHVLNADGSGALMGNTSFSASSPDVLYTAVTPLTQSLADGVGTTSVNTLVSFSVSDEVLSDDCETIEPFDDEDDEVELPEGEEPPEGENPPGKKDGEKGKRKDDPDPVETCECYDIINQRLTDINNNIAILNDNILEQMQVHNDTFAILITKMQEWTRYLAGQWREIMFEKDKYDDLRQKRLEQFLTSGSGEKIADSVQRATDALYVSDSDSVHDGDSIADLHDSVFHSSVNPDFSITDAVENIEPVHIENEYRTQSHRVVDNFDSTQNL